MVETQATNRCPRCRAELPAQAPSGLCPKCLLQAGLGSLEDLARSTGTSHGHAFTAPSVEELATHFPQLEILELLGRGGMGAVYKARQKELDRVVAIKILPAEVSADPAFAQRFLREAQALARLNHPNIVVVYDYGQSDGFYYFVMEFVEGANLRHIMTTSRLEPAQALAIIPQICDALQYAHNQGIVHRDIKPENILVNPQGRVKIADFGLVKLLGATPADHTLTGTQQVMGTLHYMAPEQVQHTHAVDHRADIYSLGVVFYEMLTGQLPIGRFDPPSQRVSVDARLDEIVLRSLATDPTRRYQQASHVSSDIESLQRDVPPVAKSPVATPPRKPQPISNLPQRYSRKAIIGAIWACLFVLVPLTLFTSVRVAPDHPEPATREIVVRADRSSANALPHGDIIRQETYRAPTVRYEPSALLMIIGMALLVLGLTAPIGSTVLGFMALGDIRASQGRIRGLPLAIFDALLYPLLLLDAAIIAVICTAAAILLALIARLLVNGTLVIWIVLVPALLPALAICLLVDVLIVRSVWKRFSPGDA